MMSGVLIVKIINMVNAHYCGLGTAALFTSDVANPPLAPRAGALPVGRITPDDALLDGLAVPADRQDWWRARLTRCHALLGG